MAPARADGRDAGNKWNICAGRSIAAEMRAFSMFRYRSSKVEHGNIGGGVAAEISNMLNRSTMILAAPPCRSSRPIKIGGVYARRGAGRVLVAGRRGAAGKNSGARRVQLVPIWVDEAASLDLVIDGFPPFSGAVGGYVAWVPSHGSSHAIGFARFSADRRLTTSLQPRRVAGRGGATPHAPAFAWSDPRRARWSQPAGTIPAASPPTILKDCCGPKAKVDRDRMGSGVRERAEARPIRRESASELRRTVGQGAIAAVLAQGGSAAARLGGGVGCVNGT